MRKILMAIAYDGTAYHGWARQDGTKTVAGTIDRAVSELTGEDVMISGASRTDAGVHALMNMAVLETESKIPAEKFAGALNVRLPEDITIRWSKEADPSFSMREAKFFKTYRYSILNSSFRDPTKRLYTYQVTYELDIERMRDAAKPLVGEHDFKSFCSAHTEAKTTVRIIHSIEIEKNAETVNIRVSGYGFLYNMVRIIVGTLIEAGRGRLDPKDVKDILEACDRTKAGPTVPPEGLTLEFMEILP
ncbi:MAG: tRNA pseudouridine(38-40) synthase TruA [Lachnospiraceae bacterium]|nr:tRNA pseudouridine(38-40) synthase TruA [Lachnospiraceae bacterium]